MELKPGSAAIPCELVRGLDGKIYVRSSNQMAMDVLSTELGTRLACVDGYENGFCLSDINSDNSFLNAVIDMQPDLDASTPEPSMRTLLITHYRQIFSMEQAIELADEHVATLNQKGFQKALRLKDNQAA